MPSNATRSTTPTCSRSAPSIHQRSHPHTLGPKRVGISRASRSRFACLFFSFLMGYLAWIIRFGKFSRHLWVSVILTALSELVFASAQRRVIQPLSLILPTSFLFHELASGIAEYSVAHQHTMGKQYQSTDYQSLGPKLGLSADLDRWCRRESRSSYLFPDTRELIPHLHIPSTLPPFH